MPSEPQDTTDPAFERLRNEVIRVLCTDHGHVSQQGGLNCRTCRRRADAIMNGPLAKLRAALARLASAVGLPGAGVDEIEAAISDLKERATGLVQMEQAYMAEIDDQRAEIGRLREDVDRLRARTHEIQAQEMAKRAALDSELAEWRNRWKYAEEWWNNADEAAKSWHMTSYVGRAATLLLVTERDEARAEAERLRSEAWVRRVGPAWLHESNDMCVGAERELTELRAENERLRAELARIKCAFDEVEGDPPGLTGLRIALAEARDAGTDDRDGGECTPACSEMHRFEPGCALASPVPPAPDEGDDRDGGAHEPVTAGMLRGMAAELDRAVFSTKSARTQAIKDVAADLRSLADLVPAPASPVPPAPDEARDEALAGQEHEDEQDNRTDAQRNCTNCDGMLCMSCRLRHMHDECVDDCPMCCAPPGGGEATQRAVEIVRRVLTEWHGNPSGDDWDQQAARIVDDLIEAGLPVPPAPDEASTEVAELRRFLAALIYSYGGRVTVPDRVRAAMPADARVFAENWAADGVRLVVDPPLPELAQSPASDEARDVLRRLVALLLDAPTHPGIGWRDKVKAAWSDARRVLAEAADDHE